MIYSYMLSASIQRSKRQQRMANHSAKYRARLTSRICSGKEQFACVHIRLQTALPFSDGL